MRIFILIFFLSGWVKILLAGVILEGKVIGEGNNGIEYVSIHIIGTSIRTVSNYDGKFSLPVSLIKGKDSIEFSRLGYEKKILTIDDIKSNGKVRLLEKKNYIDTVNVYGDKYAKKVIVKAIRNLAKSVNISNYEQQAQLEYYINENDSIKAIYQSVFDVLHFTYNEEFGKGKYKYLPTEMIFTREDRSTSLINFIDKRGYPVTNWNEIQIYKTLKNLMYYGILNEKELDRWGFKIVEELRVDLTKILKIEFTLKDKYLAKVNNKFQNSLPIREGYYDGYFLIEEKNALMKEVNMTTSRFSLMYTKSYDEANSHFFKPIESYLNIRYESSGDVVVPVHIIFNDKYENFYRDRGKIEAIEHIEIVTTNDFLTKNLTYNDISRKYGPVISKDKLYYQQYRTKKTRTYNKSFWEDSQLFYLSNSLLGDVLKYFLPEFSKNSDSYIIKEKF